MSGFPGWFDADLDRLLSQIPNPGLATRAAHCLCNAGIATLSELRAWTPRSLMKIKNFGRLTLQELVILGVWPGVVTVEQALDMGHETNM